MYVLFFKQKTAYEMRISDWSSDVCSSDLCVQLYSPRFCSSAFSCASIAAASASSFSSRFCRSASTSRAQLILSLPIRSARASRINLEKHPVKPPPPTGEQLSVPLRPTYSIATARLVQQIGRAHVENPST